MYCIRIPSLLQGFSASFQFYVLPLTFNLLNDIITDAMELARSTSRGGLSLRRIFTLALAVLFTATLWAITAGPATYAADASWSGSAIVYEGNKYIATTDEQILKDVGLESASKVYVFVDPAQTRGDPSSTNGTSPPTDRKIRLIYFETNTDPTTATEAKYKDFTYVNQGNYTNPSAVTSITFSQTGGEGTTSCDIDTGLGYIICPVTTTLAGAMDFIFDVLTGFLEVRPIETGQDSALYRAWKFMQAFANVAFVIVFLIIIYSQLTGAGISSYGLKKLLPRLIIAALLVNLSYFISSIAVDISNVLGYSLQDIFITMRNSLIGSEGNNWDLMSWESLSGFALAGGTLAVAGGLSAFIAVSDFGPEVVYLILPALVVALIAVLVALVVLAARQAIIIVLVILSPLAFVAYLLPNTEKWFTKWRELFFTMLFIFPAFSVVFGGSQLAATAIIHTADSINLIILGMLVQVAPLFITPLLIKLGGGLLGRIAGLVNDPNKGIIDRTRKFAEGRTQDAHARRISDPKGWQLMRRNARWRYDRKKDREQWRTKHTERADANWAGRPKAVLIDNYGRESGDIKTLHETRAENLYARKKLVPDSPLQKLDIDVRNAKARLANTNVDVEDQYGRLQAKDTGDGLNVIPAHLATRATIARSQAYRASTLARQHHNTEYMVKEEYAKALAASEAMRREAGGINPRGANSALAAAFAASDEAYAKAIAEGRAINEHFKLSSGKTQRHAIMLSREDEFSEVDDDGNEHWFRVDDVFTRQAAIEDMLSKGTADEAEAIMKLGGLPEMAEYRSTIGGTIAKSPGVQAKLLYAAGQTIDDFKQGRIVGDEGLDFAAVRSILKGKYDEGAIVALDPTAIRRLHAVMTNEGGRGKAALDRLVANDSPEEREKNIAEYERLRTELSKDVRKTFFGDKKGDIKSGARPGLAEIARITKPDFDLDDPNTYGDDVKGDPAKGILDKQMDDVVARSILSGNLNERVIQDLDAETVKRLIAVALDDQSRGKNARGRVIENLTDQAIYDVQLQELSKKIRDAIASGSTQIDDEVRDDIMRLARLSNPNFDPDDESTW
jgi:hypothetical protein